MVGRQVWVLFRVICLLLAALNNGGTGVKETHQVKNSVYSSESGAVYLLS